MNSTVSRKSVGEGLSKALSGFSKYSISTYASHQLENLSFLPVGLTINQNVNTRHKSARITAEQNNRAGQVFWITYPHR